MRKHHILATGLSLVLGYALASTLNRTPSGQPLAPQPAGPEVAVWRYQATVPFDGSYNNWHPLESAHVYR